MKKKRYWLLAAGYWFGSGKELAAGSK